MKQRIFKSEKLDTILFTLGNFESIKHNIPYLGLDITNPVNIKKN